MQHFIGEYSGEVYINGNNLSYLRVYWESDTGEFEVWYWAWALFYLNGEPGVLLNGSETVTYAGGVPPDTSVYSTFQICQGSDLLMFKQSGVYPFYSTEYNHNHYSCAQLVCDLRFNMNPKVSPTHVEVEAFSSFLPIEYGLQDFVYGSGYPFGRFDLDPGTYTIHARDGANCHATIVVTIPEAEGYALKYFSEYDDRSGNVTSIEIYENKYLGEESEARAAGSPLTITTGQTGQTRIESIKGSKASISFISLTDREFQDLFTSNSRQFRVDVKKEGILIWRGWLVPDFWQEPYIAPPYVVELEATDGLGELKSADFVFENIYGPQFYSGRMTHLEVIVLCLKRTGLDLPIYTAVNVFEENMEYMDGFKGILLNTFTPVGDSTYSTELQEGTTYNFEIDGNNDIEIRYNGTIINDSLSVDYGFYNSDFDEGLKGWKSLVYINSAPWIYLDTAEAVGYTDSDNGNLNTELLTQSYLFLAGQTYNIEISINRESEFSLPSNLSKLICWVGDLTDYEVVLDGSYNYMDEVISFSFTPTKDRFNFYVHAQFYNTNSKRISLDYIRILNAEKVTKFRYNPYMSGGDLSITFLSGSTTTVKIYEATKDPISQIYVDTSNYYPDGNPMSCYDVLSEQLKPYGARIFQAHGAWHVVKFDQANLEYQRNRYTFEGEYEYSEYFDQLKNILTPSMSHEDIWVHRTQLLETKPGFRYQISQQSLGYIENLLPGGEFKRADFDFSNTPERLKYFTYASKLGSPFFYSYKDLDKDGNGGIDFNRNYALFNIINAKAYLGFQDEVPSGLPPGGVSFSSLGLKNDDIVLMSHKTDKLLTNVYVVNEKGPWESLAPVSLTGNKIVRVADTFFYLYRFEGTDDDPDFIVVQSISVTAPEQLLGAISDLCWIKSNGVDLEYRTGDKLLIKIKKLFTKGNTSFIIGGGDDYYLGLEISLGSKYAGYNKEFVPQYSFIEVPLTVGKDDTFTEEIVEISLPPTGDEVKTESFTIKAWFYTKPLLYYSSDGSGAGWSGITLNFGPTTDVYSNLIMDYLRVVYLPGGELPPTSKTHRLNNSDRYTFVPDDIEVMHGDAPDVLNNEKIYNQYLTLLDGTLTQKWKRKNYYERKNLLKLLLESVVANSLESNMLLTGSIRNYLSLLNTLYDPESPDSVFMIGSLQYKDKELETDVELLELSLNENLSNNADAAFSYGFSIGFKS